MKILLKIEIIITESKYLLKWLMGDLDFFKEISIYKNNVFKIYISFIIIYLNKNCIISNFKLIVVIKLEM